MIQSFGDGGKSKICYDRRDQMRWIYVWLGLFCAAAGGGASNFDLVGFATLNGLGQNGTTGGSGGQHVQVSTLAEFVQHCQTNRAFLIELMNDIDCSSLGNINSPPDYPVGEI